MKAIRVIAVGLLISAYLMQEYTVEFLKWAMNNFTGFLFTAAVQAISPNISGLLGLPAVVAAIFITLCLAVGLFISATIYAALDTFAVDLLKMAICRIAEFLDKRNHPVRKHSPVAGAKANGTLT